MRDRSIFLVLGVVFFLGCAPRINADQDTVIFSDDFETGKNTWGFFDGKAGSPQLPSQQLLTGSPAHGGKFALLGKSTNGCVDHTRRFDPVIKEANSVLTFWYFIPKGSAFGQIHVVVYCSTAPGGRVTKVLVPDKTNEWVKVSLNLAGEISPELLGEDLSGMEINGLGQDTFLIDDVQIANFPREDLRLVKLEAPAEINAGRVLELTPVFTIGKKIETSGYICLWLSWADPDEKIQLGKTIFTPTPPMPQWKPGRENKIGPIKINIPEFVRPGKYDVQIRISGINLVNDAPTQITIAGKPRPAKISPTVLLEKADVPREANLGDKITLSCSFKILKPEAKKMFARLMQGKVLYLLADQPIRNQITLHLPADIPTGEYYVYLGVYGNPDLLAGKVWVKDPGKIQKKVLRRSLGYGTYVDDQAVGHFWYINQANAMIWDGEPYLPIGGMFESRFLVRGQSGESWRQDLASLNLIRSKGIRDTYVNPPGRFRGQWAWQPLVDKLEELDFRYGLELSVCEPREIPCEAYVVRMYKELGQADKGRKTIKTGNFMIDGIQRSGQYRLARPIEFGVANTKVLKVNHVIYALFDKTEKKMVKTGWADFAFADNQLKITVDLLVPQEGRDYAVYFIPNITFCGPFPNFWKAYDFYARTLPADLKKIHFGKNLRFFVDPTENEPGIYDAHAEFMFYFKEYQQQYAQWLEKKYKDIGTLNTRWAVKKENPLPDFKTAAELVPLQVGPKGSVWQQRAFMLFPPTRTIYELEYSKTLIWYDGLDFRDESYMEYHNRFSDEIKKAVNVPIVYKRAYQDNKFTINTWKSGGADGIGNEAYGNNNERMVFIAMEGYAKCMESARTMWSLTTETHNEGGMDFGYTGYRSRENMYDVFGSEMRAGAKGIFTFLLHTSAGWEHHALVNDPRQLDWMKTFIDAVEARREFITNYRPPFYWSFPPAGMCWVKPNDRNGFYRDDAEGTYTAVSSNGVYFTPTFDPLKQESKVVLASLENSPATSYYGAAFEQLVRDPGRKIIFVGLRRNLGALSIDRYFTPKIKRQGPGFIQVLNPTPTSKILYKTDAGEVWGLEDGDLQIIARSDMYEKLGFDPTVKYIHTQGEILPDIKKLLNLK